MKKVCMLGSGAWGTAVSSLLADNGFEVNLWCYESTVAKEIAQERCNKRYLPDVTLKKNIKAFTDIDKAMESVDWIFEAVPVKFLRSVLVQAKPYLSAGQTWVILSKGIENETLLFPSQILNDVFETEVKKVIVSGPSFAKDLAAKKLTAVDVASKDERLAKELQGMLTNAYFKCHCSSDVRGVQFGGALKNVFALAYGMLEGFGCAANTKAFMLTVALKEMAEFAKFVKIEEKTIYCLSGFGDLILTCTGGLSRNVMVGRLLGEGQSLEDILKTTGAIPEGINTVKSVYEVIQHFKIIGDPTFTYSHHAIWGDRENLDLKESIELPLLETIHEVIFEGKSVQDLLFALSVK